MINAILNGIMKLIISLVSTLLAPIDLAILKLLPDVSGAMTSVANFFKMASGGIGWAVSFSGLSNNALSLIVLYFTFKLTAPMGFYLIKLALAWYNKIKL